MSLRIATPADLEEIGKLLWMMTGEIGIGRVFEPKAREAVSKIVNEGGCILAERKGAIVGILGLTLTSWWYSKDNFITDLFFFVHPKHRSDLNEAGDNAGHAAKMIAWAKAAADRAQVPLVLSVGTDIAPLPKIRFMRKHMNPFGGSFIHKPRMAEKAA